MMDFEVARRNMLEGQVRTNDVTDVALQRAIAHIPREKFVPNAKQSLAYAEDNIEIETDRYLMQPRTIGKLLQALEIDRDDLVLDVACGLGYSSAVISRLANVVIAIEDNEKTVKAATSKLASLEIDNVAVVEGNLIEGVANEGPFDVIFINGGIEVVPESLFAQLKEGGRLGAVIMEGECGHAFVFEKLRGGKISKRMIFDAQIPVLRGFERPQSFIF